MIGSRAGSPLTYTAFRVRRRDRSREGCCSDARERSQAEVLPRSAAVGTTLHDGETGQRGRRRSVSGRPAGWRRGRAGRRREAGEGCTRRGWLWRPAVSWRASSPHPKLRACAPGQRSNERGRGQAGRQIGAGPSCHCCCRLAEGRPLWTQAQARASPEVAREGGVQVVCPWPIAACCGWRSRSGVSVRGELGRGVQGKP